MKWKTWDIKTLALNPQQQAALDHCLTPGPSLNLIARAGTGKTYTLIAVASAIPGRAFLGAFNRSIADELKSRLPQRRGLDANTLHGAGLGAWRRQYPKVKVDGSKIREIFRAILIESVDSKKALIIDNKIISAADQLIGYAKQCGLGLDTPYEDEEAWEGLIDYYDIEDEIPSTIRRELFLELCIKTYEHSLNECRTAVDFNDMLLAPLYFRSPLPRYDWFLMDEAQDTNEVRRRLATGMIGGRMGKGRMIAVGDPKQAIYGFAGATNDAMGIIQRELKSAELPLSITYRCPRAVVELARQWVPDYTAHPSAPAGLVTTMHHSDLWTERFNPNTDVILCRFTRPLVGIAANLRDRGIPCVIEGQSSKSLVAMATKWGDILIGEFLAKLEEYRVKKTAEWATKGRLDKAAAVEDRVGSIRAFAVHMGDRDSTRDLVRQIEMVFRDRDRAGVLTLCTVHRSKGREWQRVYLIGRNEYMPCKWAHQPWEQEQEENLIYVAITRTKETLIEVVVPETEPGERPDHDWWDLTVGVED